MNYPFPDLELYDLPIDNNGAYQVSIPDHLKLMVITMDTVSDEDQEQLSKILSAAKIESAQIFHLKIKNKLSLALGKMIREHRIENIISFGVHPFNLGLKIPNHKYVPLWFENLLFVYADNLEMLSRDKKTKMMLWNTMKNHLIPRTS